MVWAEDPETGERALKRVVRTFLNEKDELVHVQVNGETITCTTEHPFYVQGKGWVAAKDLKLYDKLELQNGEDAFVDDVRHEKLLETIQVFNFEVEDFHTYYVGAGCVLVHNLCTSNGTKVTGYTKHGVDQAMSRNGGRGVKPSAILEALKNPKKIVPKIDELGRTSIQYRGAQSTVALNPEGKIVSCWAKSSKYWRNRI